MDSPSQTGKALLHPVGYHDVNCLANRGNTAQTVYVSIGNQEGTNLSYNQGIHAEWRGDFGVFAGSCTIATQHLCLSGHDADFSRTLIWFPSGMLNKSRTCPDRMPRKENTEEKWHHVLAAVIFTGPRVCVKRQLMISA